MPRPMCRLFLNATHFFFSSRRRHTRSLRDWSSDVCSSDLDQEHRRAVVDLILGLTADTHPAGGLRLTVEHHDVHGALVEPPEQRRLGGAVADLGQADVWRGPAPDGEPYGRAGAGVVAVDQHPHKFVPRRVRKRVVSTAHLFVHRSAAAVRLRAMVYARMLAAQPGGAQAAPSGGVRDTRLPVLAIMSTWRQQPRPRRARGRRYLHPIG